jgi:succinyl-CoA synthetase beta subunit
MISSSAFPTQALAEKLGFKGKLIDQAAHQFKSLYELFIKTDATQVRAEQARGAERRGAVCKNLG